MRILNGMRYMVAMACVLCSSTAAFAQTGPPKTLPQDFGYDSQSDVTASLPGGPPEDAPVDRLDEADLRLIHTQLNSAVVAYERRWERLAR